MIGTEVHGYLITGHLQMARIWCILETSNDASIVSDGNSKEPQSLIVHAVDVIVYWPLVISDCFFLSSSVFKSVEATINAQKIMPRVRFERNLFPQSSAFLRLTE